MVVFVTNVKQHDLQTQLLFMTVIIVLECDNLL